MTTTLTPYKQPSHCTMAGRVGMKYWRRERREGEKETGEERGKTGEERGGKGRRGKRGGEEGGII